MKKILLIIIFLSSFSHYTLAQGVGIGTNVPDPSAKVEISSNTQGLLVPRMSTTQRNAIVSPATGLLIFNTTTNCINIFIATSWKQMCSECEFNNPVVTSNSPLCEGDSMILTATTIAGATYKWTGPNNFTSTQQNPVIPNVSLAAAGKYSLIATLNGCAAPAQNCNVAITAHPSAPSSITGTTNHCINTSGVQFSIASVSAATSYNWTVPTGTTITSNSDTAIIVTFGRTAGNITVSTSNSCSTSNATAVAITLDSISSAFSSSGNKINIPVTFTPVVSGASSYSWSFASGSPSSSTLENPAILWISSGNYNVSLTINGTNGCSSTSTTLFTITSPTTVTFNTNGTGANGSIQTFTVPAGVKLLTIEAYGAQGASGTTQGGKGAYIKGDVAVNPGDVLKILVGQSGTASTNYHGGGGGSFVTTSTNSPLIIAGGGGGGNSGTSIVGSDGQAINDGASSSRGIPGGTGGNGGSGGSGGGGGGGLLTDGGTGTNCNTNPGQSFIKGGTGATATQPSNSGEGGFGGGGSGDGQCCGMGGAGGGYSGGGGGGTSCGQGIGGGGGSYNAGTNQTNTAGFQTGQGLVKITY